MQATTTITAIFVMLFAIGNCTLFAQDQDVAAYETTFPSMGTLVSLQSFAKDPKAVEEAFAKTRVEIDRLVKIFSDYDDESEALQLTREDKLDQWQQVSPEMWEVLVASDEWNRQSDGAFDASVGQLSILWRKARRTKRVPTQTEIADALKLCGWKHVELDHATKSFRFKIANLRLDFGAIAKGYVIERAYQHLADNGFPCSLVRAGGDIRCGAPPPGRDGWKIEIANVDASNDAPARFLLSNAAVSSSGDLHQFIEIDGKRRSHVIDPKTGIGVEGPKMVTVVARNSMVADVADTTICVLTHEAGIELARKVPDISVRIVSRISMADKPEMRVSENGFDTLVPLP